MKFFALVTGSVLGLGMMMSSAAFANDIIERQVYQDPNFASIEQRAIAILARQNLQVKDIDVDSHFGKPVLEIEAYQGLQEYDIKMSYPDLRIIERKRDY